MTAHHKEPARMTAKGSTLPYKHISSPGAYVDIQTGNLLRITADALERGRSPKIWIESRDSMNMFKVSDDPFVSNTKAALICATNNIEQNFEPTS